MFLVESGTRLLQHSGVNLKMCSSICISELIFTLFGALQNAVLIPLSLQ